MTNARKHSSPLWFSIAGAVVITAAYIYAYQAAALPLLWKSIYLNFAASVVAALGAILATGIWRHFDPADRPRAVWRSFALGLWMWTVAEVIWAVYLQVLGDVPAVSPADVPWVVAYWFFGAALLQQCRLVFRPTSRQERRLVAATVVVVVGLSLAGTAVLRRIVSTPEGLLVTFLNIFYPLGDLALAAVALTLARAFGGGQWARPWIALLAFAVADTLYTGLLLSGLYAFSVESGNVLSLIADTVYLDAYIVLALACHAQLLLLRRGPGEANLTSH
jgi:hypothetical protein